MDNIYTINLETIRKELKIKKLDFLFLLRKSNLIDDYGLGKDIIKTKIIRKYTKNGYVRNNIYYITPLGAAAITRIISNNHLNFK